VILEVQLQELGGGVVVVSGPPAAGKSTVASWVGARYGLAVIAKDAVKEALADALGFGTAGQHKALTMAAFEVMWRLAGEIPSVVLDANFREGARGRLEALGKPVVEISCRCPPALCRERFAARTDRHAVHPAEVRDHAFFAAFGRPLGLGAVFSLDTSGEHPDFGSLAGWLDERLISSAIQGR
jgi:predicted kinase